MLITDLNLVNFRNYGQLSLRFPAMINVLYGDNAQGKTNVLEGLFYAAFAMSHRTNREDDLLRFGAQGYACAARFMKGGAPHTVRIKRYLDGRWKRDILLDEKKTTARAHYGFLNMVMFSPEDLTLVKGEPQLRRRYLDMEIAQTDPVYWELLVQYQKNLKQRNQLLKSIQEGRADMLQLAPWNVEFARLAAGILEKRLENLVQLGRICQELLTALSRGKETLQMAYACKLSGGVQEWQEPVSVTQEMLLEQLEQRQEKDIVIGYTGIGPHRDDLRFYVNGHEGKSFASQGQQRSCALALKLAQLSYVKAVRGEFPVLLLDDVMSELDNTRREELLRFIDGRVQTFVTVNDKTLIPQLPGTEYFHVEAGQVNRE